MNDRAGRSFLARSARVGRDFNSLSVPGPFWPINDTGLIYLSRSLVFYRFKIIRSRLRSGRLYPFASSLVVSGLEVSSVLLLLLPPSLCKVVNRWLSVSPAVIGGYFCGGIK
jgi:hypothetical protein